MKWGDARVLVVGLLCAPGQADGLVAGAQAALRTVEAAQGQEPGRWRTAGIRVRPPRTRAERDWLVESLSQPDDPLAGERQPLILEIGGRGARRRAEEAAQALGRMLCPDDFHPGPCPIPWTTMTWGLRDETRAEKALVRDLF